MRAQSWKVWFSCQAEDSQVKWQVKYHHTNVKSALLTSLSSERVIRETYLSLLSLISCPGCRCLPSPGICWLLAVKGSQRSLAFVMSAEACLCSGASRAQWQSFKTDVLEKACPWQTVGWRTKVKGTGCRWKHSASGSEMCWPHWTTFDVLWRQARGSSGNRSQETPVKYLSEIRGYSSKRAAWGDCSAEVPLQKYTLWATNRRRRKPLCCCEVITSLPLLVETWWDKSHDWIVPMDGYRLFRKSMGGMVTLYYQEEDWVWNSEE